MVIDNRNNGTEPVLLLKNHGVMSTATKHRAFG